MIIIVAAIIVPLVWAFTHHGNDRVLTLMLWMPFWLFVARVVYLTPSPDAPLEMRLNWAWVDLLTDPLTLAWPTVVILTYALIKLFTWPSRRGKAKAARAELAVVEARRQPQAHHPTMEANGNWHHGQRPADQLQRANWCKCPDRGQGVSAHAEASPYCEADMPSEVRKALASNSPQMDGTARVVARNSGARPVTQVPATIPPAVAWPIRQRPA